MTLLRLPLFSQSNNSGSVLNNINSGPMERQLIVKPLLMSNVQSFEMTVERLCDDAKVAQNVKREICRFVLCLFLFFITA
jgi:hypothetical protein